LLRVSLLPLLLVLVWQVILEHLLLFVLLSV
jgi:hypothetical protein